MPNIKIYTTRFCGFCHRAKQLLAHLNHSFEEIPVDQNQELRTQLANENNGYRTVPMIFIDGNFIGGYTELMALHQEGKI